jgi:metallophosphoesterase (TIGR00282 family)
LLPGLRKEYSPDFVIANAENSAAGFGVTEKVYQELISDFKIDVLTTGNHVWDKKEIFQEIDNWDKLLRPLNYPAGTRGVGYRIDKINNIKIATVSILGRVFVNYALDCPFQVMEKLYEELKDKTDIIIVDMHAEVTSEKKAFGFFMYGKVSAVLGTHTHVQTADERILPQGTGYQTDVGMVGAVNSVLGMETETALSRFLTGVNKKFDVEKNGPVELNATYLEIDPKNGKTTKIERIYREHRNG